MACRGAAVALFLVGALLVAHIAAQNCYDPCSIDDDCPDLLVCLDGVCNDSPDATTPICTEAPPPPALSPPSAPPPEGATCPPPPVPPPEGATCESQSINSPSIPGCNQDTGAVCCIEGCLYTTYTCSPPVYAETEAILTLNDFKEGGDGGGAGACYDVCGCTKMWYDDPSDRVVALSTGWYNNGALCGMIISIAANGKRTTATVVDECDSLRGCDEGHDYQPPCRINIVDASAAVWGDLGVESSMQGGDLPITWSRLDS